MDPDFKTPLEQSKHAKRVNLAEWRANRLQELDLPNGLTVKIRDVSMYDLALTGQLPNTLVDLMFPEDGAEQQSEKDLVKMMIGQHGQDFNTMLSVLAKVALVEPAIGDVADDTHITMDELLAADKMEIFNYLNREAQEVRPFRKGSGEPGATAQPGGGVFDEAEPDTLLQDRLGSLAD